MTRSSWVLLALAALACTFLYAEARTPAYWDSVTAIVNGEDLYAILNVSPTAEFGEIKKAFRKASLTYHPDRNPTEAAKEMYLKVTKAFDILSDEAKRGEYDHLLKHGVPTQDRYYGRYAHRVGIPDHNPWIIYPALVLVATGVHYLMSWNHHRIMMRSVKRSQNYKTKRYQNMQAAGLDVKVVKKLEKSIPDYEPADDDPYAPPIHIYGAEKPTLLDLLPIAIIRGIFNLIAKIRAPAVSDLEQLRRHMELRDRTVYTLEDAQAELKTYEDEHRRMLNSTKYKQYLRWQRKHR